MDTFFGKPNMLVIKWYDLLAGEVMEFIYWSILYEYEIMKVI